MKFFGEYLVEKKILTSDQVITALLKQINGIPTVAEIVHQKKMIQSEDLMEILKLQHENKSSFIDAAMEIGVWNDGIENEINRQIQANRVPLWQIVNDLNFAKTETISKAFDEFLGEVQSKPIVQTKNPESADSTSEPAAVIDFSPVQVPELQSSPSSSGSNYDSYCSLFTEEKKQILTQALEQLKTGGVSVSILGTLNSTIESLVAAAEAVMAKESFSILSSMSAIMSQIGKIPATSLNDELITKIGKVNLEAVELLWKFQVFLKSGTSDTVAVQENSELKKEYEKVSGGVELTRFDLDFLI